MVGKLHIGTSGWMYQHWQGVFYPYSLQSSKWLDYYFEKFETVEVNASFYRVPKKLLSKTGRKRHLTTLFLLLN